MRKLALFFGMVLVAHGWGQQYSIDWCKIAAGAGSSTGGVYSVSGTIGQHDAGNLLSGGTYSLTGGFWALDQIPTPGAPTLYILHSGNTVILYWQDVSGWSLQQNNDLSAPANWSVSSGVSTVNGTNQLTLTATTGDLFFRLQHP